VTAQEFTKLDVLHQDADLIVINKPAGLAVHAAESMPATRTTLVDLALTQFPELQGVGEDPARPGIVHRLDSDTSGVMLVARTQFAFEKLKQAFKERQVTKVYKLLVHGQVPWETKEVDLSIRRTAAGRFGARHPNDVAKLTPAEQAAYRSAQTRFTVLQRFGSYTLLQAEPHTGRTHQIRVHARAIGFPLVGDALYGSAKDVAQAHKILGLDRQFLHAVSITLAHPKNGELVTFEAPLAPDLQLAMSKLS
jgi:23S rRNA pseudouridine1911/1915/1917 synthase